MPAEAPNRGRVLVIDDDPRVCAMIRRVLERRGHTVLQAADGRRGLAVVKETLPDIILLDLNLPVMSGLEALGKLSQHYPNVRQGHRAGRGGGSARSRIY